MPGRAVFRYGSPLAREKCNMTEELPILKGILNGVVNYHNARRSLDALLSHLFATLDIPQQSLSLTYYTLSTP